MNKALTLCLLALASINHLYAAQIDELFDYNYDSFQEQERARAAPDFRTLTPHFSGSPKPLKT